MAVPSGKVMLEGAKSAEPPMNSGRTLAMAFRQSCDCDICDMGDGFPSPDS